MWVLTSILLVLCGIGLRLRQYAARASFMSDEACIVLNVMDHPATQLLGPLDYDQVCPPGFLWIERGIGRAFGYGEYAMRAAPLSAGILSLLGFAILAFRLFPPAVATCAVGWFAFSPALLEYADQVKQYSGDALVAVVLILISLAAPRAWTTGRRIIVLGLVAAVAVWFSHPTPFLFAATWLALVWHHVTRAPRPCAVDWRTGEAPVPRQLVLALLTSAAVFAASFGLLYILSIRHERDPYVYVFWAKGFPPLRQPWKVPAWLGGQLFELCRQPFRPLGVIVFGLAVVGVIQMVRRGRGDRAIALAGPIVLTIAASFVGQYPFSPSRLTLFLLPGLLLICAAGVTFLYRDAPVPMRRFWWVLPVALVVYGGVEGAIRVVHPRFHSHLRPAVDYVRAHRQSADAIYVLGEATTWVNSEGTDGRRHVEFFCYWRHPEGVVERSLPAIREIPPGRFWITFPFSPRRGPGFMNKTLDEIRAVATEKDRFFVKEGGAAYLFERHG